MRAPLVHPGLASSALLLLLLVACGASRDADLFRKGGTLPEAGAGGSASGINGGAGSVGGGSGGTSGSAGNGAGAAGSAPDSAGQGSVSPNGGATSGAGGSTSTAGASGSMDTAGSPGLSDCVRYGTGATYFSGTRHCYAVVNEPATYEAAQEQCVTLGGHLVTLANQAENDFVWNLNSEEHWIGASDGKAPTSSGKGTFTWLTGEPFAYTNWSKHQPDGSSTDCGASGLTGPCYEHCAFQWTGGEHDGEWNDRFCLHTIKTVCELEGGQP